MESQLATLAELPTKRTVLWIVLAAVGATVVLIAAAFGGYTVYHHKTTQIAHLKAQRQQLQAANSGLTTQLATTHLKLSAANVKITKATKNLALAKKNLTKTRRALTAANARAHTNFTVGYDAGNNAGYSTGFSTGHDAGLVQGSDQLTCSDDPDVYWLPACGW